MSDGTRRDGRSDEEILVEYGHADHAGTYARTRSDAAARVDPAVVAADWEHLQRDGYVILSDLLPPEAVERIRAEVVPLLDKQGRNPFEGLRTQRVYNVLQKTRAVDPIAAHPRVLALLDRLFLPNYLLSQLQVINILPGEAAQTLHYDDGFYRVPLPRPPLGAATVFAIDDFTAENGATRVVPGSHTWGVGPSPEVEPVSAVMPAGSAILFLGTLWHGGGANRSSAPRLAVTAQYCEPWLRQQENFALGVSKEVARAVSEDIRRMIGYSIHPPFMGMVDGRSPKHLLEPDGCD